LPVRFSEGFNPQPRIHIPLPRPVGTASDAEFIVIELNRPVDPDDTMRQLAEQVPVGIEMVGVRLLMPKERLLSAMVRYRFRPEEPLPADLARCVSRVLDADALEVQRTCHSNRKTRTVDIRPYIVTLAVRSDAVEFTLHVTPAGTARPSEIAGLLGYDANAVKHRMRRMEVQWQ